MKNLTVAVGIRTALTALLIFFLFPLHSKADIATYHWQRDLKGFSIEEIPGTSPVEYVAVGTVYYRTTIGNTQVEEGIHFMHLDNNGNILCDKTFYMGSSDDQYISLMAIDVAVENNNSFWATLGMRTGKGYMPFDRDMMMIVNFDASCNYINHFGHPLQGLLPDHNLETVYTNLYPTSTVFHNGHLYVCAYIGPIWHSYPIGPVATHSEKLGTVLKLDVNGPSFMTVVGSYVWDSPQTTGFPYDYDMPLRMKVNSHGNLILTGEANSAGDAQSAILAMELDPNLNLLNHNEFQPVVPLVYNGYTQGGHGIDIIEDHVNGGYYVLANHQDGGHYFRWSVTHLDNNMQANPSVPAMISLNRSQSYAGSYADVFGTQLFDDGTIFGQQMDLICGGSVPSPHLNPTAVNVDPFLHFANFQYNNIQGTYATTSIHKMQMSRLGTTGLYLGGGFTDVLGRMFTPALRDLSTGTTQYRMLSPVKDASGVLNAKFITTDGSGNEIQCSTTHTECEKEYVPEYVVNASTIHDAFIHWATYVWADPTDDHLSTTITDCTQGQYKQSGGGNNGINENKQAATSKSGFGVYGTTKPKAEIKVYPNPASSSTNVHFALDEPTGVTIQVLDALGRVVSTIAETQYEKGAHRISVNTTELATGIYIIKMQAGKQSFTHQLTVTK